MPQVIQRSIVLTLQIVASGVPKWTAERATATIAHEWLRYVGTQVVAISSRPTYQIYLRQTPLAQGAQIQILLCWTALQAHRQEINDFERV